MTREYVLRRLGEENCTVTIGLKINANVIMLGCMMKMLYACRNAFDRRAL
jgi:hypothetical protein